MCCLKIKILIVDDDERIASVISRMLPPCEQIDIAYDIDTALRYADRYNYTIILTDLLFGMEAQGHIFIRKLKYRAHGAICVLMTGWTLIDFTPAKFGCDFALQKPISLEELERVVRLSVIKYKLKMANKQRRDCSIGAT